MKVSEVAELTVTLPAGMTVPPMVTVVSPVTKFEPVMVTEVPPDDGPKAGDSEVTAGISA